MPIRDSRVAYNAYMKAYMLARYHRRRAEAIVTFGGKCSKCGSVDDLEFDHIERSSKTGEIGKIWAYKKSRLSEELAKCQLLCGECHKTKTLIDLGLTAGKGNHGTISSYRYCKCNLCRAAASAYSRKYKKKKDGSRCTPRFGGIRHGTCAGHAKELRLKIETCLACREAKAEYMRRRRYKAGCKL